MKMNKILAAGVAATLAVTSLTAVTGATVERSFDLKSTKGEITYAAKASVGEQARAASKEFEVIKDTVTNTVLPASYYDTTSITETSATLDTNWDGKNSAADWDAFIPVKVVSNAGANLLNLVGDFQVKIEGRANDNGNLVKITQYAKLVNVGDHNIGVAGATHLLPIYKTTSPVDAFMPGKFVAIDTISLETAASGVTYSVKGIGTETLYNDINNNGKNLKVSIDGVTIKDSNGKNEINAWASEEIDDTAAAGADVTLEITLPSYGWAAYKETDGKIYDAGAATQNAIVAYDITGVTSGNYTVTPIKVDDYDLALDPASSTKGRAALLLNEVNNVIKQGVKINWAKSAATTALYSPVLERTESIYDTDDDMKRNEIWELSTTRDYNSSWGTNIFTGYGASDYLDGTGQTYKETTYNKGTHANDFAGLASQVADFFNKQTNGKIIFTFAPPEAQTTAAGWISEGIPSTEVGLKTVLGSMSYLDFALFVNYGTTTGSLQAIATLDLNSGSVEFDISDILDALGGQTIGVIQDLYYGLRKGVKNDACYNKEGLVVSKVTLQYDETAVVSGDAAAADDKETVKEEEPAKEEPKNEDKADTVEIPDEPDDEGDTDVVITEPEQEAADATVDNTADNTTPVVINTNTTPSVAADENPHTGVALAVVPAIAAAAAMVLSKKRK